MHGSRIKGFLEEQMKQAIINFCKAMDSGLFLLDMPTGFGKTYNVLDFIVQNYTKFFN